MATVYSLVCFGGRLGKAVTFTDAGDVVNLTNHGLRAGTGVVFSNSGGALPTGLTAGTTYYAKQGADQNKFLLYPTSSDAIAGTSQITFSGTGSGTHNVKGAYFSGLTSGELERYGTAGSERIYDSMSSCNTARAASASQYNEEVFEVGQDFVDNLGTGWITFSVPCPGLTVLPINNAGHNGVYDAGYTIQTASTAITSGNLNVQCPFSMTGITFKNTSTGSGASLGYPGSKVDNCFFIGGSTAGTAYGIRPYTHLTKVINCVSVGFAYGVIIPQTLTGAVIANNTTTKNNVGMYTAATTSVLGYYYNNKSVGNTTNWSAQPAGINAAANNAGLSGDPVWDTATSKVTVATTDFSNYAGNDFRPASASTASVDAGLRHYNYAIYDIARNERPNYNNGGAEEVDIGAFEFDHGYGSRPASTTVTFSGVNAGSEIRVYDSSVNELDGTESCGANHQLTWTIPVGDVRIVIIHPDYKIKEFTYASVAGVQTLPVQQERDRWYQNPI